MSPYAQEKIDFICRYITPENIDSELKGSVLDLIEEIQSGRAIEAHVQKAFCMGYVCGASNQERYDRVTDNIADNVKSSYDLFKNEGLIL